MYIETAGDIDLALATGPGSRYRQEPRCREWEGQTCVAAGVAGMSLSTPSRRAHGRRLSLRLDAGTRATMLSIHCRATLTSVRAGRSTQLAEVHSSDKQWNEVLAIPLIEDDEEEEEGEAEDAGEQEEEVEADEEIENGNETVGTKRAREED